MTLKRRLGRASLNVEAEWQAAWDAWALAVVTEWRRIDPQARQHYAEFQRYEQEWGSNSSAEERAGFLSRGTALCLQWGLPGPLWVWFWRDVYGPVLDEDLTMWPRLIPQAPELVAVEERGLGSWLHWLLTAVVVAR